MNNETFRNLIESSIAFSREGITHAQASDDFSYAMELIASKQARLRLVVEFSPLPSVTCEIVREDDGELVGFLFQHQARTVAVN